MLKLQVTDDDGHRQLFESEDDEVSIGRREGNTLHLDERNVSRSHARFVREGARFFVEDAGSRFGVRVNGIRVLTRTGIHAGDKVQIGDFVIELGEGLGARGFDRHAAGTVVSTVQIAPLEQANLMVVGDVLGGESRSIDRSPFIVGSAESSMARFDHESVAAEHARILLEEGVYRIEPIAGAELRVNNMVSGPRPLQDGDSVLLGDVHLRFDEPSSVRTDVFASKAGKAQGATWMAFGAVAVAVAAVTFALGTWDDEGESATQPPSGGEVALTTEASPSVVPEPAPEVIPVDPVSEKMSEAKSAMGRRDWNRAIELFEALQKESGAPEEASMLMDLARVEKRRWESILAIDKLSAKGQHVKSWEMVQRVRGGISPESAYHADFQQRMAKVGSRAAPLVMEASRRALRREDYRLALRLVEDGLRMQPSSADARALKSEIVEAQEFSAEADAAEAIQRRKERKKKDRKPAETTSDSTSKKKSRTERKAAAKSAYEEGRTAKLKGKNALAITKFKEALRNHPHPRAHKQLGILYAARGDSSNAIEHYRKYIKGMPKATDRSSVENAIRRLGGAP
jgi:pSer/pThr/pTyr-binding forkhead associated (FHA) protein/tetratricopeptide (TPR) repeat protein